MDSEASVLYAYNCIAHGKCYHRPMVRSRDGHGRVARSDEISDMGMQSGAGDSSVAPA